VRNDRSRFVGDRRAVDEDDVVQMMRRSESRDIELEGRDLVLRSPNGTRFRLVIDDNGVVSGEVL
jgi:hypothetical protein